MAAAGALFLLENDDLNGILTLNYAIAERINAANPALDPIEVVFLQDNNQFSSQFKGLAGITVLEEPSKDQSTDGYEVIFVNGKGTLSYAMRTTKTAQYYFLTHSLDADNALPPYPGQVSHLTFKPVCFGEKAETYLQDELGYETPIRLRNAIDLTRFDTLEAIPTVIRKILVFDVRNNAFYRDKVINLAGLLPGVYVRMVDVPTWAIEAEIEKADLVIAYGRSAIESMAMGKHTIIYGVNGGDGLVTAANFTELQKTNFSGYSVRNMPIPEHLTELDLLAQIQLIDQADMVNVKSSARGNDFNIVNFVDALFPPA
jgi:hypothetical protein